MGAYLDFNISPQPDDTTCGPACLHSIYRYYGDGIDLDTVIQQIVRLDNGGTLAVFLGCHALQRGYRAQIYTYNLEVFDPHWFSSYRIDLADRLKKQMALKPNIRLHQASQGYLKFLELGGEIRMEDLRPRLLRDYLKRGIPILSGLSVTYLYREPREYGPNCEYDDLRGEPAGHFVVLHGYDKAEKTIYVADPFHPNPLAGSHYYTVNIERAICSILLGQLTYDANLLIIHPPAEKRNEN